MLLRAGEPLIITVGEPGVQGATVLGMQGWGVRTPNAADVAAATWGLANEVHMMKGLMLAIGLLSIMVAAGLLLVFTRAAGSTFNVLGPVPKLHIIVAPEQTSCAIISFGDEIERLAKSVIS